MSAVRLARAVTGREVLVKFAGAYHGHSDGLLADAGSGVATLGVPAHSRRHRGAGRRRPWSCPGTTARRSPAALAEHEVAALLAEPIAANMGVVPPAEGFLEFLREATDRSRRAARLRRGDHRLPRRPRRRPGALRRRARPHGARQGPRRRPAGRRLRRPARADGADRPRRRRLPGGDALRQPTRGRRRAGDAAPPRRRRLRSASARSPTASPPGSATSPSDRPLQVAAAPGLLTLFFSAEPVRDFAGASACDTEAHAALLPGDARARRLPAALAVRGLVRLARPRRGGDRPHARGGGARRCARGAPDESGDPAAPSRRSPRSCAPRTRVISPHVIETAAEPGARAAGRRRPARRSGSGRVRAPRRGGARGLPPPLRRAAAARRPRPRPGPARRRLPLRARHRAPRRPRRRRRGARALRPDQPLRPVPRRGPRRDGRRRSGWRPRSRSAAGLARGTTPAKDSARRLDPEAAPMLLREARRSAAAGAAS